MSFWNKINPFGSLKKAKDSKDSNGAITTPRVQEDTKTPISKTRFGKELRKDFLFDEKYLNLNHGSFGTYPRPIQKALRRYQDRAESHPDQFIRYEYPSELDECRQLLANLLHAPVEDVVIMLNATTAINIVLRDLRFEEGDVIIYFDTIYGACEKVIFFIAETTPAEAVKVEYMYPLSDEELVGKFRDVVEGLKKEGKRPRIAVFDTVASMPGVKMPYAQLSKACKESDVLSFVDGAHGVGQLDLNLPELDFDFFVSNCHKWLYTPRSCGVFYVPERNQHLIRSTIPTSHGFMPKNPKKKILNPFPENNKSYFVNMFEFIGTADNSPFLCVADALKWRQSIGGEEAIRDYCMDLAQKAGKRVAEVLGTEFMENAQGTLGQCFMSNVYLPLKLENVRKLVRDAGKEVDDVELQYKVRDWLTMRFVREHDTFLALGMYDNAWFVRLSATVYLEMEDFEWGGKVLKEECERVMKGEFLEWMAAEQAAGR